jgi:hypothetical protein
VACCVVECDSVEGLAPAYVWTCVSMSFVMFRALFVYGLSLRGICLYCWFCYGSVCVLWPFSVCLVFSYILGACKF